MPHSPDAAPILFFDSGIGGLSVLRAVKAALPNAPIVFAADYAGLPYGSKTDPVEAFAENDNNSSLALDDETPALR